MKKVASGQISLSDALEITTLMEHRRHVIETQNLEMRISKLEHKVDDEQ